MMKFFKSLRKNLRELLDAKAENKRLYVLLAEKDLQIHTYKMRFENSNRMAKLYMKEFEDRGLMYIPKTGSV